MTEKYSVLDESVQDPDGGGYVHKCGSLVMGKTVYLTVRSSLLPLAGSGEVIQEVVPYCPTCGSEPATYGTISELDTPAAKETENLRRMNEK